jgi:hypothetical protein
LIPKIRRTTFSGGDAISRRSKPSTSVATKHSRQRLKRQSELLHMTASSAGASARRNPCSSFSRTSSQLQTSGVGPTNVDRIQRIPGSALKASVIRASFSRRGALKFMQKTRTVLCKPTPVDTATRRLRLRWPAPASEVQGRVSEIQDGGSRSTRYCIHCHAIPYVPPHGVPCAWRVRACRAGPGRRGNAWHST